MQTRKMWKLLSTKYSVVLAVAAACLLLQNGFMARLLVGAGVNSVFAKLLKRAFAQPRPDAAIRHGKVDPGFPSSHAHMLSYLAAAVWAASPAELRVAPKTAPWLQAGIVAWAMAGSAWRVRLERHTWAQVLAGGASGSAGAALWAGVVRSACAALGLDVDAIVDFATTNYPGETLAVSTAAAAAAFATMRRFGPLITGKLEVPSWNDPGTQTSSQTQVSAAGRSR